MKRRRFGSGAVTASEIGFGAWATSIADLEEYAAAAAPLTDDEVQRIDAAVGAGGLAA